MTHTFDDWVKVNRYIRKLENTFETMYYMKMDPNYRDLAGLSVKEAIDSVMTVLKVEIADQSHNRLTILSELNED